MRDDQKNASRSNEAPRKCRCAHGAKLYGLPHQAGVEGCDQRTNDASYDDTSNVQPGQIRVSLRGARLKVFSCYGSGSEGLLFAVSIPDALNLRSANGMSELEISAQYPRIEQRLDKALPGDRASEELTFILSYLAHNDQDANHAWMARRIRAVLAGKSPSDVAGWQQTDGVREPQRVAKDAPVSVTKTDLGYRLAIPHAWAMHITITDDEAATLSDALARARCTDYPRVTGDMYFDMRCPECGEMLTDHVIVTRHAAGTPGDCDESFTGPSLPKDHRTDASTSAPTASVSATHPGAGGGDDDGYMHPSVLASQLPEVQAAYCEHGHRRGTCGHGCPLVPPRPRDAAHKSWCQIVSPIADSNMPYTRICDCGVTEQRPNEAPLTGDEMCIYGRCVKRRADGSNFCAHHCGNRPGVIRQEQCTDYGTAVREIDGPVLTALRGLKVAVESSEESDAHDVGLKAAWANVVGALYAFDHGRRTDSPTIRSAADVKSNRVPDGCSIDPFSSRACERGTRSCVVYHDERKEEPC